MTNIAVIPCRGGSKGIPRKNLQSVSGIPLVVRTIFASLAAGIDHIFVSTDDDEISNYAHAAGAKVLRRPSELAQDSSSTDSVLTHAIDSLISLGFQEHDNLFLLQATSPFTKSETIRRASECIENNPGTGVFTATEWHGFIWNYNDRYAIPHQHDHKNRRRRQDLAPQILETGGLYGGSIKGFLDSKVRFVEPLIPILVDRIEAIEIDTWDDLKYCNSISARKEPRIKSKIKVVFSDFDGVFTDNRVLQFENGEAGSIINRSDGVAISLLKTRNVPFIIITGERNGAAFGRSEKLGIPCIYSEDKLRTIVEYCSEHSLDLSQVAYIGNDTNDIEALATCGWSYVPSDAENIALSVADQVLHSKGGFGVIRDLVENFLI